jgi:hypothetical protein
MAAITEAQRQALAAAGWTEEEATAFAESVGAFRDGLPPRQREAFNGILAAAGGAAGGEDVQGYLVVLGVITVLIGMLMPAVQ